MGAFSKLDRLLCEEILFVKINGFKADLAAVCRF